MSFKEEVEVLPGQAFPMFKLMHDITTGKFDKNFKMKNTIDGYFPDSAKETKLQAKQSFFTLIFTMGKLSGIEAASIGTNVIQQSMDQYIMSIGTEYELSATVRLQQMLQKWAEKIEKAAEHAEAEKEKLAEQFEEAQEALQKIKQMAEEVKEPEEE